MERNGLPVAGYDLDAAKTKAFLEGPAAGRASVSSDLNYRAKGGPARIQR